MSEFLEKSISKELSGGWGLTIKALAPEYVAPSRMDILTEEGQSFKVVSVEEERDYEETYINVQARHICFDLENIYITKGKVTADYTRDNIIIDKGYDGWQVDYKLKGTLNDHLAELFKYTSQFTVGSVPATDVRTVSVSEGSIFENLKIILDRFSCGFDFDNTIVNAFLYSDILGETSTGRVAYSENNINMTREFSYDDVISKLYAEADIVPTDAEEYHHIVEIGSGNPEYFVDFGKLETEAELSSLANEYYNIRSNPQPRYSVDIAEISLIPDQLSSEQVAGDYSFSVGKVVTVIDADLGISENMVVVGYDYSLLTNSSEAFTSQVKLGTLDKERLPPDFEIFQGGITNETFIIRTNANDVKELVAMVRDYIKNNIFGGGINSLDGELVNYATRHSMIYPSGLGWVSGGGSFSGSGSFVGLDKVLSGFSAYIGGTQTVKTGAVETFNPEDFVKEEFEDIVSRWDFEDLMKFWVDTYISSLTNVASQLNAVYDSVIDTPGTSVTATVSDTPTDIMKRVEDMENLGWLWQSSVTTVINYALSQAGNPNNVYTEIGGGRKGYIPCIAKLWDMVKNVSIADVAPDETETLRENRPKIFTSTEDPVATKGKDGDIWLKYTISGS